MARTGAGGELWKKPTHFRITRIQTGTIGDTTTTAAITGAGNEATIAVTAITNFTASDPCLVIGDGGVERVVIGTPNTTMPATPPPLVPQSSGARFVEAVDVDLGKISKDSLQVSANKALTAVFEEIGDTPVVYIPGTLECELSFGLLGANVLNWQFATGYAESETGAGSSETAPTQGIIGLSGQAVHSEMVAWIRGIRHDSKKFQIQFLNAYVEASISTPFGSTGPAVINGKLKASALKIAHWT